MPARAQASQLDYSQLAGLPVLREAIAEQVQSRGTRCDADQVQVVMGAQRGLDLIAHMLLDPGDAAWMEDPGYTGARGALAAAGANVIRCRSTRKGWSSIRCSAATHGSPT